MTIKAKLIISAIAVIALIAGLFSIESLSFGTILGMVGTFLLGGVLGYTLKKTKTVTVVKYTPLEHPDAKPPHEVESPKPDRDDLLEQNPDIKDINEIGTPTLPKPRKRATKKTATKKTVEK